MNRASWFSLHAYLLTIFCLAVAAPDALALEQAGEAEPDQLTVYETMKSRYDDDVEGNWTLARWCQRRGLQSQRSEHLERVVELDPDHQGARRALGFFRVDGQWFKRDDYMTSRGYVRHRGRWMLPQEKVLLDQREQDSDATRKWMRKIKLWLSYAEDRRPDLQQRGLDNLRAIDDPSALEALDELLGEHEVEAYRLLLVAILANIEEPRVTSQLVARSLLDPSPEVRSQAVELLAQRRDPDALVKYTRALHADENLVVRRAAIALGALNDPSVVPALIEALITTHKVPLPPEERGSSGFGFSNTTVTPLGQTAGTLPGGASAPIILPSTGGLGLSYGGGKRPQMAQVEMRNNEVLFSLNELTGANFGFDKDAWRQYWETEQRAPARVSPPGPGRIPVSAPLRRSAPERD